MSYSFSIKAASKAAALAAITAKLDETVIATMPAHKRDRDAILANAKAVIDHLDDDESKDVTVSVNGYLSWSNSLNSDDAKFTSVGISCSAGLVTREQ